MHFLLGSVAASSWGLVGGGIFCSCGWGWGNRWCDLRESRGSRNSRNSWLDYNFFETIVVKMDGVTIMMTMIVSLVLIVDQWTHHDMI